ncbi:caspase family protein [Planktothrix agardhii]|jgi:hypothetical protein|uniref:caspase family protein n=1 Tax=Planktothrix agardhii TaxID=1160 RepID=UPI001D0B6EB9|nr:caspase family protein [Planktothrix agardhii]MCB8762010.1 caspase family protein [Planktothrix agardhii 1813]
MKRYICIAIGINQYQYLQPLNYAQKDAEAIYEYLVDVAGFPRDQSLLITDKSPQMSKMSTYPNRENIVDWVESFCKEQLGPEDVLWFFFSGHGFAKDGRDYLLPIDGNPTQLETTGIPIQELFDYFKAAATDKILVLLDINRAQGAHAGESVGTQTAEIARKLKIPTILSCQPEQLSRETSALRQGFFTSVLLEGLKAGQFSTLDRLIHGLEKRLPEVTEQHLRPRQNPVFAVYPASKLQQVLLPEIRQVAINLSNGIREINMATVESHQNGTAPVSEDPLKLSLSSDQGNGDRGSATGEPVEPGNLPPNSPASVIQMNSQPPASSTEDTMTESSFLQRLILWSGATALVLLLGVFLTNKPIFLGQKTAKSSVETSTVVKTPKPLPATTKPESTPPTPTPASPVQLLDESKLLLKDVSASDFSKAIAIIRQIPASDPQYKEAQGDIEHWSKTILVIAQGRALSQNLPGAVDAIKLLPDANPEIYQQGQKQLEEWEAQLKVLNNNQGILNQAKALIKPGQASSYSDAIGLVQKIPADQPGYLEAEKLIDQWGNQIWEIAQSRAKKKQYDNAIEAAKLVPENTSAYDAAKKAIADWKTNK